jgi:HlyD family secretion protein
MSEATAATAEIDEFLGKDSRSRWKRWGIFIGLLAIVVIAVIVIAKVTSDEGKVFFATEKVVMETLDVEVTATGNLRPTNQVDVGSEVSGRIDQVYVDVNDQVARGQVLARINTDVIEDQIKQARASLQSARASVAQAQATLEYDTAQLSRLQEVWRLSDGKVPSRAEMEIAEANVVRDKASLASAQASVASSQAQLSSTTTNRNRAIIVSPVSGVVLARQVEPGQTVAASFNTPTLFVIAEDLSQMQLRVSVDEADVGQVKGGQRATFTVDAYPGREFPARVERVDLGSNNTANQAQNANSVIVYEARLAVSNPDGLLRPGMTATANIATDSTGEMMLVPNAALRFRPPDEDAGPSMINNDNDLGRIARQEQQASIGVGSRQNVYVLDEDGQPRAIEVVTGVSDGRKTVVNSDELKPDMEVITGQRTGGE